MKHRFSGTQSGHCQPDRGLQRGVRAGAGLRQALRCLARLAFVAAIATHGAPARAEPGPRVSLDLGFGFTKSALGKALVISPLLEAGVPLAPDWAFVARWGFAAAAPSDGPGTFMTGNPSVGFALRVSEGLVLTPLVTLPLARANLAAAAGDPDAVRALAYNAARGVRGGVDPWLWVPNTFSPVLALTWAHWFDPVLLEIEPGASYVVPLAGAASRTGLVFQARVRAAVRFFNHLWAGVSTALVVTPADDKGPLQLSVGGELRFTMGAGFFAGVRLVANIGGALGTSFARDEAFWGLHLDLGTSF